MKLVTVVLLATFISACSPAPRDDPAANAMGNLFDHFNQGTVSLVSLMAQEYCSSDVKLAGSEKAYVDCRVMIKGYVHWDVYYCSTKTRAQGGRCFQRPPTLGTAPMPHSKN